MNVELITSSIKIQSIILLTIYIAKRLLNREKYSKKDILIIIIFSLIITTIYKIAKIYFNTGICIFITYFLTSYSIKILNRNNETVSMLTMLISLAMCLLAFALASLIVFFLYRMFYIKGNIINFILLEVVQIGLVIGFFKIKRFRKGFDFLQNRSNNDITDIIIVNISTTIILMYCLMATYYDDVTKSIFVAFIIIGITMIITIQKTLTMYYKQKLMKQTLEEYESDIKEKDDEIERLRDEKFNISKITHEFYNRQRSLELAVQDEITNKTKKGSFNEETAGELGALDKIKDLTSEYSEKLKAIKTLPKLQLTEIPKIDNMFKYMQTECDKNNIEFRLKIVGDIFPLVNHIISKNKLETLIGDHIRDAIIAINYSGTEDREILAILGTKNNKYELSIYDTGIDFEIDTLLKLGLEPATTHKDSGGSGIGFITTFETLKETKASLIIKEEVPSDSRHYTKCVTIRFDNKHQYKICSHRINEIKNANKGGRKIILETDVN